MPSQATATLHLALQFSWLEPASLVYGAAGLVAAVVCAILWSREHQARLRAEKETRRIAAELEGCQWDKTLTLQRHNAELTRSLRELEVSSETLRRSEARFASAFHTSPDGIIISRLQDSLILDVNEGLIKMTGYAREELVGHRALDLQLWADPTVRANYVARIESGEEQANSEAVFRRRDGSEIVVLFSTRLIEMNNERCVLSTGRDVTDRQHLQAQLQREHSKLEMIFQHTPAALCALDFEGLVIREVNPAFCTLSGYAAEELVGHTAVALGLWVDLELRARFHAQLRRDGAVKDWNGDLRCKDGSIRSVLVSADLAAFSDEKRIIFILHDVTERLRLEAQLRQAQRLEAVGLLAGGVAHDFNNLLTAMLGYGELALEELSAGTTPRNELLEMIRAAQRAAGLTRQLLAFGRQQVLAPVAVHLDEVVAALSPMLTRLLGHSIQIQTSSDRELWPVLADQGQIEQVIMNLALNARDAMPEGGTLAITATNVTLDAAAAATTEVTIGSYVLLSVKDTGHGMDAQTLQHIWEPFFTTKAVHKGTGLGLPTVYGIVRQSRGAVQVESAPGEGSTFRIYLPRAPAGMAVQSPTPAAARTEIHRGAELVLLVEDEAPVRQLARLALERQGYAVLEAADIKTALECCQEGGPEPALLLTDMLMPGMNGCELATRLLRRHPRLSVVFMSGYTEDSVLQEALQIPGSRFVQKPFAAHGLLLEVRLALDWQAAGGHEGQRDPSAN